MASKRKPSQSDEQRGRGRPKTGEPKGRSPAYLVYARIDPAIGEAWEAFQAAQQWRPTLTEFVELLFRRYLTEQGFFPRPQEPRK